MKHSVHLLPDSAIRLMKRDGITPGQAAERYGISVHRVKNRIITHRRPRPGIDRIHPSGRLLIPDIDRIFLIVEGGRHGYRWVAETYTLKEDSIRCWRSRALAGVYGEAFKRDLIAALAIRWEPPVVVEIQDGPGRRFNTMADLLAATEEAA